MLFLNFLLPYCFQKTKKFLNNLSLKLIIQRNTYNKNKNKNKKFVNFCLPYHNNFFHMYKFKLFVIKKILSNRQMIGVLHNLNTAFK